MKKLFIFSILVLNLTAFNANAQCNGPDTNGNDILTNTADNVTIGGPAPTSPTQLNLVTPNTTTPNLGLTLNNTYNPQSYSSPAGNTFISFQEKWCNTFTMGIIQNPGCGSGMFHMSPATVNTYATSNNSALGIHFFGSRIGFSGNPYFGAPACPGYNSTPGYLFDGVIGSSGLQIGYNTQTYNFPPLVSGATTPVIMAVNGAVTIGPISATTINTNNYNLFVSKGIVTEEVVVNLQANWSDYVFAKDYKLMPLSDVKTYVDANSHLPEVPAACEIAEKGVATGEMLNIHMKKIEELTLYLIQMEERIKLLPALEAGRFVLRLQAA